MNTKAKKRSSMGFKNTRKCKKTLLEEA